MKLQILLGMLVLILTTDVFGCNLKEGDKISSKHEQTSNQYGIVTQVSLGNHFNPTVIMFRWYWKYNNIIEIEKDSNGNPNTYTGICDDFIKY